MSDEIEGDRAHEVQARFGANLRAARHALKLTQEQVGQASGKDRVYVQRVESGGINVTIKTMLQLAQAVGSTVEDLLQPQQDVASLPLHVDNTVGSRAGIRPGWLAIELPAGTAFEAGRAIADLLRKPVQLVDPSTRSVVGIAGASLTSDATSQPE